MKALVNRTINVLKKTIHDGETSVATKKRLTVAHVSQPDTRSRMIANSSRRKID